MIQRRNGHRSEREFEIIQMVHDMKMKDDFIMKMTGGWIEEGEEEQHEEGRREEWVSKMPRLFHIRSCNATADERS